MRSNRLATIAAALMWAAAATAQTDPVLMTINGKPVSRSEFEYSYNKNNSEGVIDKKSVDEYIDLFINYKLKVAAALEARIDTATSFKREFEQYRNTQIRPSFVTDADVEREAQRIYNTTKERIGEKGLVSAAHIFVQVKQTATEEETEKAKARIDSIYSLLENGADFAETARNLSEDKGSAYNGGMLPWFATGQTLKEFEDVAFALKDGEMSKPFLSPAGYHIVLTKGHKQFDPYEAQRESIMKFIESRNMRDKIAQENIDSIVNRGQGKMTAEEVISKRAEELMAKDPQLKYLIQEYHDGLLLYEISNSQIWEKASKDEEGLRKFFKKNKKKYSWAEPRFKGMAYHVKSTADAEAVKKCVKKLDFGEWADALRKTFNSDSIRVRVEKGIFKKGDHALVDRDVFGADTTVTSVKDYPIDGTYGKMLKKGPEDYTDVRGLVTADYQDMLEKEWVEALRRKFTVSVDPEVLKTVNKHK